MKKYDLVAVGTGFAGLTAPFTCAKLDLRFPSLITAFWRYLCLACLRTEKGFGWLAEIMDWIHRMKGLGIEEGSRVNWEDLMAFKRTFKKGFSKRIEKNFLSVGIDAYHGVRFSSMMKGPPSIIFYLLQGRNLFPFT